MTETTTREQELKALIEPLEAERSRIAREKERSRLTALVGRYWKKIERRTSRDGLPLPTPTETRTYTRIIGVSTDGQPWPDGEGWPRLQSRGFVIGETGEYSVTIGVLRRCSDPGYAMTRNHDEHEISQAEYEAEWESAVDSLTCP